MVQDTFGLGITQPVSVWNRPLKIEPKGFFHPERFPLLSDFQPGFQHWLKGFGLDVQQVAALAQRLPHRFALALHQEWLRQPQRYAPVLEAVDSPFTRAADRQRQ